MVELTLTYRLLLMEEIDAMKQDLEDKEAIAIRRFEIVAPLCNPELSKRERIDLQKAISVVHLLSVLLRDFLQVKYIKASTLFNEIEAASSGGKLLQYQNQMASYDLLIIDEFGNTKLFKII